MKSYYQQKKYELFYNELESALETWADDHELKGYRAFNDDGSYNHKEIALNVVNFIEETFAHMPVQFERYKHFLQGLGLSIPFYYNDIYQLYYKSGMLNENDSDKKHQEKADKYWSFMAMRLKNIANSK